jgi:CIC family chloride channel protein
MSRLRLLAHTRHIVVVTGVTILLPAIGLFLTTIWLTVTGIGEVSLFKDMDLAKKDPYKVFPFRVSLGKVVACVLTIGFGGSAGIEGPGKWYGAALGLQYHRLLRAAGYYVKNLRHLARPALVMVRAGAAAALAAVFRAPISGALMAATSYLWLKTRLQGLLSLMPLLWRGLAAGVGLSLLALPSHFLWKDLAVTQGSGLELIHHLIQGNDLPRQAALFLALKLFATALTFAGGGIGGLWLPALAMGAAVGAGFDGLLGIGSTGYLTMVGAAAMAGALHETILVPVVFLAETTGQVALVVPALIGTTISYLMVREAS